MLNKSLTLSKSSNTILGALSWSLSGVGNGLGKYGWCIGSLGDSFIVLCGLVHFLGLLRAVFLLLLDDGRTAIVSSATTNRSAVTYRLLNAICLLLLLGILITIVRSRFIDKSRF